MTPLAQNLLRDPSHESSPTLYVCVCGKYTFVPILFNATGVIYTGSTREHEGAQGRTQTSTHPRPRPPPTPPISRGQRLVWNREGCNPRVGQFRKEVCDFSEPTVASTRQAEQPDPEAHSPYRPGTTASTLPRRCLRRNVRIALHTPGRSLTRHAPIRTRHAVHTNHTTHFARGTPESRQKCR